MSTTRPVLRSISPDATAEEVAAIVAAITACSQHAADPDDGRSGEELDAWVLGSRLVARRAGLQRGPWRLSGRISRHSTA